MTGDPTYILIRRAAIIARQLEAMRKASKVCAFCGKKGCERAA